MLERSKAAADGSCHMCAQSAFSMSLQHHIRKPRSAQGHDVVDFVEDAKSGRTTMLRVRLVPTVFIYACAVLASGCTNMGAVRDFTATSASMTGYREVTERYVTSADRQLADLPPDKRFDASRADLEQMKAVTAQERETLLKLHATTTGYMAALAQLAGADAYSISPDIEKVAGALTASDRLNINADHVTAYANIAQRVTDWVMAAQQAKDVKTMVKRNGADMDKLLEAMEWATQAYGIILQQEVEAGSLVAEYRDIQWSAKLAGDVNLTPQRREVIATLLRRSDVDQRAQRQAALRAQQAAAAGVTEVRKGHQEMLRNVDRLSAKDVQAALRKATSQLKSIRQSISDL